MTTRPGSGLALVMQSDACQSGKMVTLLNSLFFMFKILLLPNYRLKYYDYIVKWCSAISCKVDHHVIGVDRWILA